MKHKNNYRIYEINQDLIDFLRGDGIHQKRSPNNVDRQIYSHYGEIKKHSDKYIGIIIEFQNHLFFAPLTHDGKKNWFDRQETCDFELMYDGFNKYTGALLICKALPLTNNLVRFVPIEKIAQESGRHYATLCRDELRYLNSPNIHDKIQDKMQSCIYGKDSPYQSFRINYQLAIKNVAEYNALLLDSGNVK